MSKYKMLFAEFQQAFSRLQEALQQEKTSFMRDSSIQRFEITFDLAWKLGL